MTTRPITLTWDLLSAICAQGARLTWPARPNEEAVCVVGLSDHATVERVIVNPDRTITIVCDDPHFAGAEGSGVAWRLERREG